MVPPLQFAHQGVYVVLSVALNRAVKLRLLTTNPCESIEKPSYHRGDMFPFTFEETQQILDETEPHPLYALFVLVFTIGMRQSELFGLKWEYVDFHKETLRVRWQLVENSGHLELKNPKSRAGIRTIELPAPALDALQKRRKMVMADGHAGVEYVFCTPTGKPIRRANFRMRNWNPLLKRLGLKHRGFHHCRHTYATLALGENTPVHVVSRILGHARPSITLDTYSHVLPSDQAQATQRIEKLFARG